MTTTITTTKRMTTRMRTTTTTTTTKQQQQQQQQQQTKQQQQQQQQEQKKRSKIQQQQEQQQKNKKQQPTTTKTTTTVPWLCFSLPFWGGLRPPQPPLFFALASSQTFLSKRHQKVIIFFALLKVSFLKHSLFEKKWWPPIFSGNAIKIGVLENFEKPVFLEKNGGTTSCPFWRPPIFWV